MSSLETPPALELGTVTTKETLEESLGLTSNTEGSDCTLYGGCGWRGGMCDGDDVRTVRTYIGWSGAMNMASTTEAVCMYCMYKQGDTHITLVHTYIHTHTVHTLLGLYINSSVPTVSLPSWSLSRGPREMLRPGTAVISDI